MRFAACQLPEIIGRVPRAIATIKDYAARAETADTRLVCFPEAYLQGYDVGADHVRTYAMDIESPSFDRILKELRGFQPVLVIGLIERSGGNYFNSAVVVERGAIIGCYRKNHLLRAEQAIFERGEGHLLFELGSETVGVAICADLNYTECIQATARAGAGVLVCPCNNMMSQATAEKWKHRHNEIRSERAREAGVWLLSSDVTGRRGHRISYGPTALIDPEGRVVDQVPFLRTGMLVANVIGQECAA